MLHTIDIKKNI